MEKHFLSTGHQYKDLWNFFLMNLKVDLHIIKANRAFWTTKCSQVQTFHFPKCSTLFFFPYTQWVPSRYLPHTTRKKLKQSPKQIHGGIQMPLDFQHEGPLPRIFLIFLVFSKCLFVSMRSWTSALAHVWWISDTTYKSKIPCTYSLMCVRLWYPMGTNGHLLCLMVKKTYNFFWWYPMGIIRVPTRYHGKFCYFKKVIWAFQKMKHLALHAFHFLECSLVMLLHVTWCPNILTQWHRVLWGLKTTFLRTNHNFLGSWSTWLCALC